MPGTDIGITFACGCQHPVSVDTMVEVKCSTHDERRVSRVDAPAPRFHAVDCDPARMGPLAH